MSLYWVGYEQKSFRHTKEMDGRRDTRGNMTSGIVRERKPQKHKTDNSMITRLVL